MLSYIEQPKLYKFDELDKLDELDKPDKLG
jgi:hypothetical protein